MIKFRDVLAGCSIAVLGIGIMVLGGNAKAASIHDFAVKDKRDCTFVIDEVTYACSYCTWTEDGKMTGGDCPKENNRKLPRASLFEDADWVIPWDVPRIPGIPSWASPKEDKPFPEWLGTTTITDDPVQPNTPIVHLTIQPFVVIQPQVPLVTFVLP